MPCPPVARTLVLLLPLTVVTAFAEEVAVSSDDLVRLAEAKRLVDTVNQDVWPDWHDTPFPILLVADDEEWLVDYPRIPDGFAPGGFSAVLDADLLTRARQFDAGLLAAFPAFGPPAVVVVGTPQATAKASTAWVLSVAHEHFHQRQMNAPEYFASVTSLGLAKGDESGMWMLLFPFPYDDEATASTFAALSRQLAAALRTPDPTGRDAFWNAYTAFLDTLTDDDRRYLSFQLWQEGVSRYVELRVAEAAAERFRPSLEFSSLPDYEPFAVVAARLRQGILESLTSPDLAAERRVSFYAFGAGLALLLDQEGDAWRQRYLQRRFALEDLRDGSTGKR